MSSSLPYTAVATSSSFQLETGNSSNGNNGDGTNDSSSGGGVIDPKNTNDDDDDKNIKRVVAADPNGDESESRDGRGVTNDDHDDNDNGINNNSDESDDSQNGSLSPSVVSSSVSTSSPPSLTLSIQQYWLILQRHPSYRLYLMSLICQDVGDWFVKIGAYLAVQQLTASYSGQAVSYLMLTIMLPQVFLSPLGGWLADAVDRRRLMLVLDVLSGTVVWGYMAALKYQSISLLYLVSTLRTALTSVYDPVTRAILPMVLMNSHHRHTNNNNQAHNNNSDNDLAMDLKRAVSINYLAWAVMRIIGGLWAGYLSASMGISMCFVVDSATYYLSAIVLFQLKGDYRVTSSLTGRRRDHDAATISEGQQQSSSQALPRHGKLLSCCTTFCQSTWNMTVDLIQYLWNSGLATVVLLRMTGASIWGWADVLNVSYTHVANDEAATSRRLGILMSCLGSGSLLGPILGNTLTHPHRPRTLQAACLIGMAIMGLGWLGIWAFGTSLEYPNTWFAATCAFSAVRTTGASMLIANALLLLPCVISEQYLGRVSSIEFALTMGMDSLTNWTAGKLQDQGLSGEQIAGVAILLTVFWLSVWLLYHFCLGGAKRLDNAVLVTASSYQETATSDEGEATDTAEFEIFQDEPNASSFDSDVLEANE